MSVQPLSAPLRMGDLDLPNPIVMAPLTRMRAGSMDHEPTALQAEYYAQRASAGLIVAEATAISGSLRSFGTPALLPIPTCAAVRRHCRHPMSTFSTISDRL
jgi:2,4-dienoyl-CoA reductase-like NADH-dependent reductase (Old Yellow Enzyme family)